MVSLIYFFLGVRVFLSGCGYCGDVFVDIIIGSENGCDMLQFRGFNCTNHTLSTNVVMGDGISLHVGYLF
jgi:hypothetical protein